MSMQENDPHLGPLLQWKQSGVRPQFQEIADCRPQTRHYWYLWDSLDLREGLLYKKLCRRDGIDDYVQFVVPLVMKEEVLHNMYNSVLSGHLGETKTKEKLSQRFYWFEMKEDFQLWISSCETCGANKPPQKLLVQKLWDF